MRVDPNKIQKEQRSMNINKEPRRAQATNMNSALYGTQKDIFEVRNIKIQRGKNPRTQRNVIMNSERTEFSILYVRLLLVYLCVILSLSHTLCLCLSVCA